MKKIMIMLLLIASMNRITPVLANAIQREVGLEIQKYKWKIV